jgi:spermidine synthase
MALVVAGLSVYLPNIMHLYSQQIAIETTARSVKTLLVHEGRAATVSVLEVTQPGIDTYRDMFLDGVEQASTRLWHVQIFKLLSGLPVLLHETDKPKDTLVIAFGAGMSAGSVLISDQVKSLDVVDLNPDIEGINDLFKDVNGDVFHRPQFHFHNDDGRNYLVTTGKKYDLIICDSTHPHAYDSWVLYTQEFYRDVKKRLRPEGIFAQWVPVDPGMWGEIFQIHLNTFRSVFPHTTLWYSYGSSQAFLLATHERFSLDAQRMQQKLDRLPEWFRAHDFQLDTVARLSGYFWLDEAKMSEMIGNETRVNTDNLHFFGKQSANWAVPPQRRLPMFQSDILPYLKNADEKLRIAVRNEQHVAQLVTTYWFTGHVNGLLAAYCLMPQNAKVLFSMGVEFPQGIPKVSCK